MAGPLDPEEFCDRCFAGTCSDEHHARCVVTGFAIDGETAHGSYVGDEWERENGETIEARFLAQRQQILDAQAPTGEPDDDELI